VRRRDIISLIGGAVAWPHVARAQQPGKLPTIGFLGADASSFAPWTAAFVARLKELGWIEGRTVRIEYRWSEGKPERVTEIADEFVTLKADVIVANGGAVAALKQATASIPIVFALATDPLGSGLVASLARPGGNVTGLSIQGPDTVGKRIELLRQIVPGLHRLAILLDSSYSADQKESEEVQAATRALNVEALPLEIRRAQDITPAFATLNAKADALYLVAGALVNSNRTDIMRLALEARLPTIVNTSTYVEAGALISYGPNVADLFRRAAEFVDTILHGTKPADIPVEQPTKFDLVINLTTAKALGLDVPHNLLVLADEVIE
jgi:putative tryptophan/tyrosine transport system substrate-binding protein